MKRFPPQSALPGKAVSTPPFIGMNAPFTAPAEGAEQCR